MDTLPLGLESWERTIRAAELVKNRLLRASASLNGAGVEYAVVGGNAVAAWVGRIDQSAVRFTQDVDLLIRRVDFETAKAALEAIGFVHRCAAGIDMFLDGPDAKARDAVHVVFAGERVRPQYALPAPDVTESDPSQPVRILNLDALVRMKLTSYRDKDRTHLRDLIDVGLVDESWCARVPGELESRLRSLIDTPEG